MVEEPRELNEWWMDDRTRLAVEQGLGPGDSLMFTACEERPLRLSRSQVLDSSPLVQHWGFSLFGSGPRWLLSPSRSWHGL